MIALLAGVVAPQTTVAAEPNLRDVTSKYAFCVVSAATSWSRDFVLRGKSPSISPACMFMSSPPGFRGVKFSRKSHRYKIAEALLKVDYPRQVHIDFSRVGTLRSAEGPVATPSKRPDDQLRSAEMRRDHLHGMFGECVARARPIEAHALVLSPVESTEENSLIRVLETEFKRCETEAHTAPLGVDLARGAIALHLYLLNSRIDHPKRKQIAMIDSTQGMPGHA